MPETNSAALGRGSKIVLLLFALFILGFTKTGPDSWNDASRLGTIQGLVEYGSFALDDTDYLFQGDKVRIGGPLSEGGHYYSHQPPMLAVMGAIPYRVLRLLGWEIDDSRSYKIITLSLVGLPLLLGLVCLARLMGLAGAPSEQAAWLLAAAALGTLALPYALVLNQHAAVAGLVMAALLQTQQQRFAYAGLLLSLAATVDLTAAFFAVALLLPIVRVGGIRAVITYGLAALPLLIVHFAITYSIAGDLLPLGLHTEAFEYAGSPFLLMDLTGGMRDDVTTIPLATYVFGALFGASGLFSHHPVLLFAVATGALILFEQFKGRDQHEESAAGLIPSLDHAVLLGSAGICFYYLSQSNNYGGSAFGMRWFCVFAPALMLLPAVWLGRRPGRHLVMALFVPLLVWSIVAAGVGAIQPWTKLTYNWKNTSYGREALARGETVPFLPHVATQLNRASTTHMTFDQARWDRNFLNLLNKHRLTYLLPRRRGTDVSQRHRLEIGVAKLERVVELFEEENVKSAERVWSHYWCAEFYRRLGRMKEAQREIAKVLELSPSFYDAPYFDRRRKAADRKKK